jgi:muconolactone D-isomerase
LRGAVKDRIIPDPCVDIPLPKKPEIRKSFDDVLTANRLELHWADVMEFLVEFEVNIPSGIAKAEVENRERAEASAAAKLVDEGHLVRVWNRPGAPGEAKVLGLYRADSEAQLDALLSALPLYEWMQVTVTPLAPHPNDPAAPVDRSQP